jgi:hypothetical protein
VKRVTTTTGEQFVPLPSDFLEARNVQATAGTYPNILEYAEPNYIDYLRDAEPTEYPTNYSIVGSSLEFAPVPAADTTIELVYYSKIPALDLTSAVSTNWVLQRAPDAYLYGALVHTAPYLIEDERLPVWSQAFGTALASLNRESERASVRGSRLVAKRRTFG